MKRQVKNIKLCNTNVKRDTIFPFRLAKAFCCHPFLCSIILCQLTAICYINIFCLQDYLGYDSSANFLQVIEIWKQKTLLLDNFSYQSTLAFDYPVLFAVPLYGLLGNVFTAYGIANLFVLSLLIAVSLGLLRRMNVSTRAKLFFYVCFLTPYIAGADGANPLGYFYMMFTTMAAYSFRTFIILFIWLLFIDWDKKEEKNRKRLIALSILCTLLCILTGSASGYFVLIFGIAPVVFFYLVRCLKTKHWVLRSYSSAGFLVISIVATLAGKMITKYVLHFEGLDDRTTWVSISDFWGNLTSIFGGYLKLLGVLPLSGNNVQIISASGICYGFRLVLAALFLIGGMISLINTWKESFDSAQGVVSCGIIANILILALVYSLYGATIFEERYLIVSFISLLFLFSSWSDYIFQGNNSPLKVGVCFSLFVSIVVTNFSSYVFFIEGKNDHTVYEAISNSVRQIGNVAYVTDDLGLMARNIRCIDNEVIYKLAFDPNMIVPHHWGDYTYYDENGEYDGPTALLTTAEDFNELPEYLKNAYKPYTQIEGTNILVYKSENNLIDFTSGITDCSKNIDFPYTRGICTGESGQIEPNDGSLVTDGTEGYVIWGPYTPVKEGRYNFKVNYQVLNAPKEADSVGYFDVAVNVVTIAGVELDYNKTSVTISNVMFDEAYEGGQLEYRVYENEGVILKIRSFEIEKMD